MNITVSWDDELPHVVRYDFRAVWTWEDFFKAVAQAKALIDTAPGNVGVLMVGESRYMRLPPNSLTHFRSALQAKHPKTCIVVVVSQNIYLSMMTETVARLTGERGGKLRFVNTIEEARALVKQRLSEESTSTETPDGE